MRIRIKVDHKHYHYLEQLLTNYKSFKPCKKKVLIDENCVQTDAQNWAPASCKQVFRILKDYFTEDAWLAVLNLYSVKVKLSSCLICTEMCLKEYVMCSKCNQWYSLDYIYIYIN